MSGLEVLGTFLACLDTAVQAVALLRRHWDAQRRVGKLLAKASKKLSSIRETAAVFSDVSVELVGWVYRKNLNEITNISELLSSLAHRIAGMSRLRRLATSVESVCKIEETLRRLTALEMHIETCGSHATAVSSVAGQVAALHGKIDEIQAASVNATAGALVCGAGLVPTARVSARDTDLLRRYGMVGRVPAAESLRRVATALLGEEKQEAVRFLKLASGMGDVMARRQLGWVHYSDGEPRAAEYEWREAQHMGDRDSVRQLGRLYLSGKLGAREAEGVRELETASVLGDEWATYYLALCKMSGVGTEQCDVEAFTLVSSFEKRPFGRALTRMCHFHGVGTVRDKARAGGALDDVEIGYLVVFEALREQAFERVVGMLMAFFKFVGEDGCGHAAFALAHMYNYMVRGGNQKEAAMWYARGAELGHCDAQVMYAECCEFGVGVQREMKSAFVFYQRAADQGHVASQLKVAKCYMEGDGVRRDVVMAQIYLRRAGMCDRSEVRVESSRLLKILKPR